MIRIEVSAEAYAVLCDSLGDQTGLRTPQRSSLGGYYLWLDKRTVNQLAALRRGGEAYSDVIVRLAELEAA